MATNLIPGSTAGKQMKLSEATKMVDDYTAVCGPEALQSITMSASFIKKIIDQPGCEYIRVFVALDGATKPEKIGVPLGHTLVFIGADSNGKTIKNNEDDTQVYEDGVICPPDCPGAF